MEDRSKDVADVACSTLTEARREPERWKAEAEARGWTVAETEAALVCLALREADVALRPGVSWGTAGEAIARLLDYTLGEGSTEVEAEASEACITREQYEAAAIWGILQQTS